MHNKQNLLAQKSSTTRLLSKNKNNKKKKANNKKKSSIITTSSVGIGQQYLKIQGMVKGNGITQQSVVPPDTFIIDIPTWNKSV